MLARHGQRLSPCSLFVLSCQACSYRQNEVEYFGDWLWITFWDSRSAMPRKAMIWCTVAVVLMTLFVILNLFVRCTPPAPGSYYFDVGSKILKRVQDDGVWDDGVWDEGVWDDGGWTTGRSGRGGPSSCLCGFVRDTLAQRLVLAGLCARALWARAHPARPFARSGVYRTCHRNSAIAKIARKRSRFIWTTPN